MAASSDILQALAPTGELRASINLGNAVLAGTDPATGAPRGITVDLAHALGRWLGVGVRLVAFDTAGKSVDAVTRGEADIGFFAIDPKRAEDIRFSAPYVLIEGCYMVRDGSPLKANEEVDRDGATVVVGAGSAYDLYLTRELKHASIVRAPSSPAVVDHFIKTGSDVAAGVKQQLEIDAARIPGVRLLPGRFMVIRQAMGCARARGQAAQDAVSAFVEEMKATGFVAESIASNKVYGATVAGKGD